MLQVFSETSEINVFVYFRYFVYSENHQSLVLFKICASEKIDWANRPKLLGIKS